jgi:hypothetical protein
MIKKLFVMTKNPSFAPRIGLDEARTSDQDVFLLSGVRAVRQAFHNLSFFPSGNTGIVSPCSRRGALCDGPTGQTRPVPRGEKRGGSPLDSLGHSRVKRIELQIELVRDSGQTDLAI